jgi:hypothetical protein
MRGQKKKQMEIIDELITVDGNELRWHLHSEPQITSEFGPKGRRYSIRHAEGTKRELILEFPFPIETAKRKPVAPQSAKISPQILEAGIRQAIEAGWRSKSRGRVFSFRMEEDVD